jgi:hypothetical protein
MMKKIYLPLLCLLVGTAPFLTAQQDRSITAQNALLNIESRFGGDAVKWISEMKATGGQPQPLQWDVLAFDPVAPGLLHHFRASGGVVQDGGADSRRYPNDAPDGYFSPMDLRVDSGAAFTIAEAEARKAHQGFDSCDYFLKLKEFSREPLWRLELVDAVHRLVGSIYISGSDGQVLRTVWVGRDAITGLPKIFDSKAPDAIAAPGFTSNDLSSPSGDNGFGGLIAPAGPRPFNPSSDVILDPAMQPAPAQVPVVPRTGSIFKEFPVAGGGGSGRTIISQSPNLNSSSNPLDPAPGMSIPEPGPLLNPVDPVATSPVPNPITTPPVNVRPPAPVAPAPPISVPSSGGSSVRIPPPPVPR